MSYALPPFIPLVDVGADAWREMIPTLTSEDTILMEGKEGKQVRRRGKVYVVFDYRKIKTERGNTLKHMRFFLPLSDEMKEFDKFCRISADSDSGLLGDFRP